MASGKKRASPGADEEKSPVKIVELSDEDAQKLQDVQGDIARAELILGTPPTPTDAVV
jgi:template-activating factor I